MNGCWGWLYDNSFLKVQVYNCCSGAIHWQVSRMQTSPYAIRTLQTTASTVS